MELIHGLIHVVERHPFAAAAIAIGSFVGSILVTLAVIVRLPADYFAGAAPRPWFPGRSRPVRIALHVVKNLGGALLVALGVVMSFPGVPGQGVLTILLGVMLLDVPGKRRVERWLVSRASVRRALDKIRARRGRPPLVIDEA